MKVWAVVLDTITGMAIGMAFVVIVESGVQIIATYPTKLGWLVGVLLWVMGGGILSYTVTQRLAHHA